jgi:hypothetical protein
MNGALPIFVLRWRLLAGVLIERLSKRGCLSTGKGPDPLRGHPRRRAGGRVGLRGGKPHAPSQRRAQRAAFLDGIGAHT